MKLTPDKPHRTKIDLSDAVAILLGPSSLENPKRKLLPRWKGRRQRRERQKGTSQFQRRRICHQRETIMRMPIATLATIMLASSNVCVAQTNQAPAGAPTTPAAASDGRTDIKAHQENIQQTPQGQSGPLNTTSGGAPAASPQGQTPPGMQAAPEGSNKTIVDTPNK
jgi:hypothetical protein